MSAPLLLLGDVAVGDTLPGLDHDVTEHQQWSAHGVSCGVGPVSAGRR